MTLAYLGRMACLCLASFFLVHVVLGLMASAVTPTATRMAGTAESASRCPVHAGASPVSRWIRALAGVGPFHAQLPLAGTQGDAGTDGLCLRGGCLSRYGGVGAVGHPGAAGGGAVPPAHPDVPADGAGNAFSGRYATGVGGRDSGCLRDADRTIAAPAGDFPQRARLPDRRAVVGGTPARAGSRVVARQF